MSHSGTDSMCTREMGHHALQNAAPPTRADALPLLNTLVISVTIKADTRTLHFHRVAAYKRLTAAVCSAARGRGDQPLKERALLLLKLALNALLELAQAAVEARRERLRVCGVVEQRGKRGLELLY